MVPLRSPRPRALPLGLALALALHALGLATVALVGRELAVPRSVAPEQLAPEAAESGQLEVELQQEGSEGAGAASAVPPREVALARITRRQASRPRVPATSGEQSAGAEPAAEEQGDGTSSHEPARPAPPGSRPPLSLDALGVGPKNNPFLAPSGRRPSTQRRLADQIDHVLRSALAKHDQQLGLGPEGPALAAVTDLVMQSTSAPNTSALLSLRTDSSGETVHVEVAEASGDTEAWNAIAAALQKALHGKKLRVPAGSGGVTLQLRVESREQLPSGADPGLAIDLFGQEVKSGAGDRSTRLQLLTPKIVLEQYQVSSTDPHAKVPVVGVQLTVLGVMGDPVDIAAVARRVVHAHLVSLETHPRESPR